MKQITSERKSDRFMTLREIYDYIGPLLEQEDMANQEAVLIIHLIDGDLEVSINENRTLNFSKN